MTRTIDPTRRSTLDGLTGWQIRQRGWWLPGRRPEPEAPARAAVASPIRPATLALGLPFQGGGPAHSKAHEVMT